LSRTRVKAIQDWGETSANWHDVILTRYPGSPTSPVVNTVDQSGKSGPTSVSLRSRQTTVDTNHGFSATKLRSRSHFDGDIGGDFSSTISAVYAEGHGQKMQFHGLVNNDNNWVDEVLTSPIFAVDPRSVTMPTHSLGDLAAMGTTAIARCSPTNNVVDLAASVHEIFREGLPHLVGHTLWKGKTSVAKKASEEYLNVQFGWLPLASDVRGASYALANAAKLLEAYQRNSGKIVRRRYEFPVVKSSSTTNLGPVDAKHLATNGQYVLDVSKPVPTLYKTTEFYRRTWFSGAFTYHLPSDWNSRDWFLRHKAEASYLYGIELTPDTLWNAAPWTWAVDWFSNAGDVVKNLSSWSTDGLVLKWGYIMEHSISKDTYFMYQPTRLRPYGTIFATPVVTWYETKRRQRATPFGFAVTWNTLSYRQKAIAAALGITRW
jgi:hypothetical protein